MEMLYQKPLLEQMLVQQQVQGILQQYHQSQRLETQQVICLQELILK